MTSAAQTNGTARKQTLSLRTIGLTVACAAVHIHLRAETKPAEHRSALTPTTTAALIEAGTPHPLNCAAEHRVDWLGFKVSVERSDQRIFDDEEFGA